MKKLNAMGVGPKIGMVTIPYLIVTIFLSIYFRETFYVGAMLEKPLWIAGIVLLSVGAVFYVVSAIFLLRGIKTTTLMTNGTYYLCQNPLYSGIILMIIPGVSFVMHTWLILTTSLVAYILFRIFIPEEYREMESFFGQDYLSYKKNTPEFIPLPFKKWFKSGHHHK